METIANAPGNDSGMDCSTFIGSESDGFRDQHYEKGAQQSLRSGFEESYEVRALDSQRWTGPTKPVAGVICITDSFALHIWVNKRGMEIFRRAGLRNEAQEGRRMDRHTRKCRDNWVITVESKNKQHSRIIQEAVAKRAYQLFEQRGRTHGFDLDDWLTAEKEFLLDDFDGNRSRFHFLIECPRDPEVTTILSMTTHSMVVFRSRVCHVEEIDNGPDVVSVHILPEEIDPNQADVNPVNGLLHVHVPKKNHRSPGRFVSTPTKRQGSTRHGDGI